MENDLLVFLSDTIREHADDPVRIIETACEYLESHLEFGRLIINNNVDPLFPQRLFSLEVLRETVMKRYSNQQDPMLQEYLTDYLTYLRCLQDHLHVAEQGPAGIPGGVRSASDAPDPARLSIL